MLDKKAVVFGGGELLPIVCDVLIGAGYRVSVVLASRFKNDLVDGVDLDALYVVGKDLESFWVDNIESEKWQIGISISAPWIFRSHHIRHFESQLYNIHYTNLPAFRGGAPVSWRILSGCMNGGCVIHKITDSIDSGEIVARDYFRYPSKSRYPRDFEAFNLRRAKDLVYCWSANSFRSITDQNLGCNSSHYWPRLSTEMNGYIDWGWTGPELERFILAFSLPYQGARTFCRGQLVQILDASFELFPDLEWHPFQAGIVIDLTEEDYTVRVKSGILKLKKEMVVSDSSLKLGDRLHTPSSVLDESFSKRARV